MRNRECQIQVYCPSPIYQTKTASNLLNSQERFNNDLTSSRNHQRTPSQSSPRIEERRSVASRGSSYKKSQTENQ